MGTESVARPQKKLSEICEEPSFQAMKELQNWQWHTSIRYRGFQGAERDFPVSSIV